MSEQETATDRWAARHPEYHDDRPRTRVWYPASVPYARLETIARSCSEPDVLPSGPPIAHLTVGGVDFGGPLEDLELLFDAAREQLVFVREQYDRMREAESLAVSDG